MSTARNASAALVSVHQPPTCGAIGTRAEARDSLPPSTSRSCVPASVLRPHLRDLQGVRSRHATKLGWHRPRPTATTGAAPPRSPQHPATAVIARHFDALDVSVLGYRTDLGAASGARWPVAGPSTVVSLWSQPHVLHPRIPSPPAPPRRTQRWMQRGRPGLHEAAPRRRELGPHLTGQKGQEVADPARSWEPVGDRHAVSGPAAVGHSDGARRRRRARELERDRARHGRQARC